MKAIVLSDDGHGFIASRCDSSWQYKSFALNEVNDRTLHQVVPLSPLPHFLVGAASSIYLVSAEDGMVQHTFSTEAMISRSIRCVYTCARQAAQQGVIAQQKPEMACCFSIRLRRGVTRFPQVRLREALEAGGAHGRKQQK